MLRCSQAIRKGDVFEAIRLSESEPALLELVELFDFPERIQWESILQSIGIPPPPVLFTDLAKELEKAYATASPLEPLLKKHRVLAIARAPLSRRIAVLREILVLEPDHAGWKSDLADYEKTRLREIEKEIPEAIAAKNPGRMSELLRELEQTGWEARVPEPQIRRLRNQLNVESRRNALSDLGQAVKKLQEAHRSNDAAQGLKWAQNWYSLAQSLGDFVPLELQYEVDAALLWVEEQRRRGVQVQRFEHQLESLRATLQSNLGPDRLTEAYARTEQAAAEIGGSIPEPIRQLFEAKLASAHVRGNRTFRTFLVVLVILCLMAGGGITWGIISQNHRKEAEELAQTLQGYLDRKEFDAGELYAEEQKQQRPKLFAESVVAAVDSELRTAASTEKNRKELFRDSLQRLRDSLKTASWDEHAYSQAKSRAATKEEEDEIGSLEKERNRLQKEKQRQIDLALQIELDAITTSLRPLLMQTESDDSALGPLEEQLQRTRKLTTAEQDQASDVVKNQRDRLIKQLEQRIGEIKQSREVEGNLEELTKTVGNLDAYVRTLKTLAEKYPNLPMSKDFLTLSKEKAVWETVELWNRTIRMLPQKPSEAGAGKIVATAELMGRFLAEWEKQAAVFAEFPERASVVSNLPYYKAIAARENKGESILAGLEQKLQKLQPRPLWLYFDEKEGNRYYLTEPPKPGRCKYLLDLQGKESTVVIPEPSVRSIEEAPQVRFAKTALEKIRELDETGEILWAETPCPLLKQLQDDRKFDPLLKFLLLKEMILLFGTGDCSIERGYAKHLAVLNDEDPDAFVNWVDPKSSEGNLQRASAIAVLERLPGSEPAADSARKDAVAFRGRPIPVFERIGWAEKTTEGGWRCVSERPEVPRAGLCLVRAASDEKENANVLLRFVPLEMADTTTRQIPSVPGLIFGAPIYLKVVE